MSSRLRSRLLHLGSFLLGALLLWLALRNVDFGALGDALRRANYWYLLPLGAILLGSHALRAWRWQMLLEALPDDQGQRRRVPFKTAFYSVMIGYMVNYAAPRLGEVARTANLATRSRLPFSGVLGTVVVERLLDVLVLAVGLLAAVALLADRTTALAPLFAPTAEAARATVDTVLGAWWLALLIGLGVIAALAWVFRALVRQKDGDGIVGRFAAKLLQFRDGLASVLHAPRRLGIALTTVAIWACYLAATYLPLPMLGITGLDLADAWVLLMIGAVGMAVPSPGGVGSYHYVTIRSLESVYRVATAPATAYAVLSHAAQLVLYAIVGALCLVLQGASLRELRETAAEAEPSPSPHPSAS